MSDIIEYAKRFTQEPEHLCNLREEINKREQKNISVSPETGAFLSSLVFTGKWTSVFEAGTFYGYSSLWMALSNSHCHITTCDVVSNTNIEIAKRYWTKAQCQDRISFHHQDAEVLLTESTKLFDCVFIDASKKSYKNLTLLGLEKIKQHGVLVVDNLFLKGRVLDETDPAGSTVAAFNTWVHQQKNLHCTTVPVGDGLTIIKKI